MPVAAAAANVDDLMHDDDDDDDDVMMFLFVEVEKKEGLDGVRRGVISGVDDDGSPNAWT